MAFRCIPIETATADRFRAESFDDGGNPILHRVADGPSPCRHCLRDARDGEELLLLSWHLPRPLGIYWTPSPIFLHASDCPRFDAPNVIPDIVRARLVSVRAYDAAGMCLYDLGQVSDGDAVDSPLARAIDDDRTAFVNIHTAKPGCLLCQVERITG
jgi:hypothetical protein